MRKRLAVPSISFTLFLFFASSPASSQGLVHDWSLGVGQELFDSGTDVAVDAAGNVAVVGAMSNSSEVLIAKYAPDGTELWSTRASAGRIVSARAVFDGDGNLYVTGGFQGTLNLGGSDLVSAGDADMFLARFDADGNHVWSWSRGDTGRDLGSAIVYDAAANRIVVAGASTVVTGYLYLGSYDLDGNPMWESTFIDPRGSSGATDVALDTSGNIVVVGSFDGTQVLGGGDLVSNGMLDMFVARYDASGAHLWSESFGQTLDDVFHGVAVDTNGDIVMTGTYGGALDLGGGPLPVRPGGAIVLARFDGAGAHIWSQSFGAGDMDRGNGVALDADGNIVMVGQFGSTGIDFGGGPLSGGGSTNIFVSRFTSAGAHLWSAGFGDTGSFNAGVGTITDANGDVYVTGRFEGSVDFGGGTIDAAGGSVDLFLARFGVEAAPEPGALALDIKPGSCPNTFNTDPYTRERHNGKRPNGVLPVALLGGEGVDVHDVDTSSLTLEGVAPLRYSYEDVGTPYGGDDDCGCNGEDGDGYVDLTLKFSRADLVDQIGSVTEPMELTLSGMMKDGTPFEVTDCVTPPGWGDGDGKDDDGDDPTVSLGPDQQVVLKPATPNPFNPTTRIAYEVARSGHVRLSVYNVRGEHVATLVDGRVSAGAHEVTWEAGSVPSGVYFYRIEFAGVTQTRKALVVK